MALTDELDVAVGATSEDMRFTVEAVACVGCCGLAPVAVIAEKPLRPARAQRARKLAKQLMRRSHRMTPRHAENTATTEIRVCAGSGCVANGSLEIADRFETAIAAAGAADRFDVVRTGCHGLCALGPVVVVSPDGTSSIRSCAMTQQTRRRRADCWRRPRD